jgi:hypothetical protein
MKQFKENDLNIVDYMVDYVFNCMDGDYNPENDESHYLYKIEIKWFSDLFGGGLDVIQFMEEYSDNALWEGFEYIDNTFDNVSNVWLFKPATIFGRYVEDAFDVYVPKT